MGSSCWEAHVLGPLWTGSSETTCFEPWLKGSYGRFETKEQHSSSIAFAGWVPLV